MRRMNRYAEEYGSGLAQHLHADPFILPFVLSALTSSNSVEAKSPEWADAAQIAEALFAEYQREAIRAYAREMLTLNSARSPSRFFS